MTAASPGIVSLTLANRYYDSHEEYVFAPAEKLRKEYQIIVGNGLTLQLDCTDLAMERHISNQNEPLSGFQDLAALHIRTIKYAPSDIPVNQVRLHVCWGNNEAPHICNVPLEDIIDLLDEAKVAHWFWKWQTRARVKSIVSTAIPLPEGLLLVAGVIDTKTNYVDQPRLVADRVHKAETAAGVAPTQVKIGTDCGFGTSAGANRVDAGVVWLKIQAMREGAEIASRELL